MMYYPIKGTLQETSEKASPYSFFSLTRKYGLREMWDEEHAKFYNKETKHDVADYIKPLGICVDNGGTSFVRCCLVDQLGIEHIVDVQASVARDDPEFVANVLKALFGYNVYKNLYSVFGKALNVLRLEPEAVSPDSDGTDDTGDTATGVIVYQTIDGYPLTGGFLYETHEYNYIDFYHIVDPLHMNDNKPKWPDGSDTEEGDSDSDDGSSSEEQGSEGGDGTEEQGGDTGSDSEGQQADGENQPDNEEEPAIPQPEVVIHGGYGVKIAKPGFSRQLSEEEE